MSSGPNSSLAIQYDDTWMETIRWRESMRGREGGRKEVPSGSLISVFQEDCCCWNATRFECWISSYMYLISLSYPSLSLIFLLLVHPPPAPLTRVLWYPVVGVFCPCRKGLLTRMVNMVGWLVCYERVKLCFVYLNLCNVVLCKGILAVKRWYNERKS